MWKANLTLCGTRKLQFFYAEILPEFKNRPMPKTVNATCKKIKKVKKSYKTSGIDFSNWEFWVSVAAPDTLCFKGLNEIIISRLLEAFWSQSSMEKEVYFIMNEKSVSWKINARLTEQRHKKESFLFFTCINNVKRKNRRTILVRNGYLFYKSSTMQTVT